MTSNRTLLIGVIMNALALLVVVSLLVVVWTKVGDTQRSAAEAQATVAASARQSCQVQSIGLQAQVFLTQSLDGFHALLTLPVTAAQRKQRKAIPKKLLRYELGVVAALNRNLAAYVALQRKQPHARTCP